MSSSGSDSDGNGGSPMTPTGLEFSSTGGGGTGRQRRMWTKQEDERLRLLVSYWGDQGGRRSNWDKIAANFEDRTSKDCRKRWFHSLDPKLRRGKWNKSEDKILREAYQRLGPAWQRIAQLIPGRTDDQCAKRYNDVLDPSVQDRLRAWDANEDQKLLGLYATHGSKWQTIARDMPGRTGLTCRNRWRKLMRPPRAEAERPQGDTSPANTDSDSTRLSDAHGLHNTTGAAITSTTTASPTGTGLGGLPFDIPGSNQVAGFPAGADASWLFGAGAALTGGPLPAGTQRHLTLTIEDPTRVENGGRDTPRQDGMDGGPPTQHAISEIHLERILQHAAEHKQQVVIHQHVYQVVPAPPTGTVPLSGQGLPIQAQLAASSHGQGYQHAGQAGGDASVPLNDLRDSSSLLRTVHPPVQPPDPSSMSRSSLPGRHHLHPQHSGHHPQHHHQHHHSHQSRQHLQRQEPIPAAPPDEFLSRPLLFEEEQGHVPFEPEQIDFLAFNPS